jgi:hypothetical protein
MDYADDRHHPRTGAKPSLSRKFQVSSTRGHQQEKLDSRRKTLQVVLHCNRGLQVVEKG